MPAPERPEVIVKSPTSPPSDPAHGAAFIFMHGLGDDGHGWSSKPIIGIRRSHSANIKLTSLAGIADQFQSGNKMPHLTWVFPSATENRDAMTPAWYAPTPLTPFPSSRPELDDPEDEDGMMQSAKYITSLIDDVISKGIPLNRIVLGGFSQGCAMTLLMGLTSKYADQLAGLVGLSGYLPLVDRIQPLRAEAGLPSTMGNVPIFVARGDKDMLVPKRYLRICKEKLEQLGATGLEVKEYEGLGHQANAPELRDLCAWLEKVVPALE